jgi:hypothetical protein
MLAILGFLWLGAATPALAQTTSFVLPAAQYDNGSDTTGIAVADVDLDGNLDLIVAACDAGYIRVFPGFGDGTFDVPYDFAGGVTIVDTPSLWGLAVADFDGDGYPDIATGNLTNEAVAILLNDGSGVFSSTMFGTPTEFDAHGDVQAIVAGRFNADANIDLAIVSSACCLGNIVVLLGDGTGNFSEAPGSPMFGGAYPYSIRTADLDGNGTLDLVVPDIALSAIFVLLGNGSGAFDPAPTVVMPGFVPPSDVAIFDFNGDNKLDLVVAPGDFDNELFLFTGAGNGQFTALTPLVTDLQGPNAIEAADFNGDGFTDVAVVDMISGTAIVFEGDGTTLNEAGIFPTEEEFDPQPVLAAVGDLNGDGKPDLAVGHAISFNTAILLNDTCCRLVVTRNGTGGGTVTSLPVRIDCGAACGRSFAPSTIVTLTAVPAPGSLFAGWTGAGCSGTGTCVITLGADDGVTATFDVLVLSPASLPSGTVGIPYSAAVTATNGTGPYVFTVLTGTLPPGLVLTDDGQIGGMPNTAGTFAFTIGGTDSGGAAGSASYSVTIAAGLTTTTTIDVSTTYNDGAQSVGLIATVFNPAGVEGGLVTFTVRDSLLNQIGSTVSAPVNDSLAIADYTLPGGTSVQTLTITAVYAGTVSFLTSSGTASLVIDPAPTTTAAANATVGFSATNQPVTLSATVTSPGGTVNAGAVTFTVRTAGLVQVGSTASASVTGGAATAVYTLPGGTPAQTLTVTASYAATPNFGASSGTAALIVGCPTITILPTVAPPLQVGHPFSMLFSASGVADAAFSLTGTVPPGLALNGATLSGTPTTLGIYSVTVTATSAASGGCTGTRTYSLPVLVGSVFVTGAGGGAPLVRAFDSIGVLKSNLLADDASYAGGIRVALGDVTGDGVADIITAPGRDASTAMVRVIDGATGTGIRQFEAYPFSSPGGTHVAAADVNGDGFADIVTGRDGAPPEVKVFDGRTGALISDFLAYPPPATGGVRVAAGDIDGDGFAEIMTGQEPGGTPEVRVFHGDGTLRNAFMAYAPGFTGGVFVAAGDIDGDGRADIITGADAGGGPHVQAFSGADLHVLRSFFAYSPLFTGGVRVAAGDVDGDGRAEIITAPGPGGSPHVRVWSGATGDELASFFAYDPAFADGVYVGAPPAQSRMAIDPPGPGDTVPPIFNIGGWAGVAGATTDSGVDAIHAWAVPVLGGSPIFVGGDATLGVARPDVAAIFGPTFAQSGFNLPAGPLPAGTYDLFVYAHSAISGTWAAVRIVRITVVP